MLRLALSIAFAAEIDVEFEYRGWWFAAGCNRHGGASVYFERAKPKLPPRPWWPMAPLDF